MRHKLTRLEFGDVAWTGNGPTGPVRCAVEIKKVQDALNCITSGRFAGHQLKGLLTEYKAVWLIVEGQIAVDWQTGMLVKFRGKKRVPVVTGSNRQWMYADLSKWLTTMEVKAGLHVRHTTSRVETARLIVDLYGWWTEKEYSEHRAHLAFDETQATQITFKPTLTTKIAAQLPGLGWVRAQAVGRVFRNPVEMVLASEEEWLGITGIGKKLAKDVQKALVNGSE